MPQGADEGYGVDAVRGDAAHPSARVSPARGLRESEDPDGEWLTRPMVRSDGELRQTQWDVALARAVEGLQAATAGPRRCRRPRQRPADQRGRLRAREGRPRRLRHDELRRQHDAVHGQRGHRLLPAFGSDAPPCTYADISDADRHVVWGANPAVAHPVLFRWVRSPLTKTASKSSSSTLSAPRLQRTPNITSHLTRGRTSHWLAPSLPVSSNRAGRPRVRR